MRQVNVIIVIRSIGCSSLRRSRMAIPSQVTKPCSSSMQCLCCLR